ncbi:MAG: PfkB family carbohydrate kinase [Candidatus Firestonebacteria bacterium]
MSLIVVGSIALDTVVTPFKTVKEVLGGSATYFSYAASYFNKVRLVGVVGEDFPKKFINEIKKRAIDITGLKIEKGKTFRWTGEYKYDLNIRETKKLELNVFANFSPDIPDIYKNSKYVFLGNINPTLQLDVLNKISRPKLIAGDTIECWIKNDLKKLLKLIKMVDIFFMNDSEARELSGVSNLVLAARKIRSLGPKIVVIKKGEHGSLLFSDGWHFAAPAYPLENVFDPTGAGDSFAGGFMGYISTCKRLSQDEIKKALIFGTVTASYCVEDFSLNRFRTLSKKNIYNRFKELKKITHFEDI